MSRPNPDLDPTLLEYGSATHPTKLLRIRFPAAQSQCKQKTGFSLNSTEKPDPDSIPENNPNLISP